ncbi:MAG: hypothetical protein WD872_03590 [Pirellulaceae bacterium]
MPIETDCQGCRKRLRVADEHAGKLAKCPHCQTVYTVPQSAVAAAWGTGQATGGAIAAGDRWHLKTPDGLTFGPVTRGELDRWLREGRIAPQSQILHEGAGHWVWAGQIYPDLAAQAAATAAALQAKADSANALNPHAPGGAQGAGYPGSSFQEPHHGALILVLSLLGMFGFFMCETLSVVAVALALIDLSKMKRGVMDPSGRGLTIAGLVLGLAKLLIIAGFFVFIALQ